MIHNFCMCTKAKNNELLGSCSTFPCDNYRSKPGRVRKHLSSLSAEAEKIHLSPSDLNENMSSTCMDRTGSRNLDIKKSFAELSQNLHKTLPNMRITGLVTYQLFLLPLPSSGPRSAGMAQWTCWHGPVDWPSFTR